IRYGQDLVSERRPTLFTLLGQSGAFGAAFLVSHEGNARAIMAAIESRVREADASLNLASLQPLEALYDAHRAAAPPQGAPSVPSDAGLGHRSFEQIVHSVVPGPFAQIVGLHPVAADPKQPEHVPPLLVRDLASLSVPA